MRSSHGTFGAIPRKAYDNIKLYDYLLMRKPVSLPERQARRRDTKHRIGHIGAQRAVPAEIPMDHRSRRSFLGSVAGLGATMGVAQPSQAHPAKPKAAKFELSTASRRLLSQFGLTYPIFQAPAGAAASPDLVIAVCNAGAIGGMAVWPLPTDEAVARVAKVRASTSKNFYVNYALAHQPTSLQATLDAGAPVVQFSWGMPDKALLTAVRNGGAKMGIQVTSAESAREALDLGADYLVCQGTEAGGHVQASSRLLESLPRVLEEAKSTPVVASGGISTGSDIRTVLSIGASGAVLGTRFVATRESFAHQVYKDALLRANKDDTVLTVCFQDGWPNAPHRVLRNGTFNRWDAAGCPPAGKRPGEGEVVATRPDGGKVMRYAFFHPNAALTGSQLLDLALYAGDGVGAVRDIPSAAELVTRLWKDCLATS
jgi:nitronate monooxygenase